MTVRAILRWLLLLQLLAALGVAWAAQRYGACGPAQALACGFGAVLLVRLLIAANNFLMSARFGSPTPPEFALSAAARFKLFGEEFMATMLYSSWYMALGMQGRRIDTGSTCPPVLLVHGYGCNSGYWHHLVRRLDAARISHATVDLEPVLAPIDDYVPLVKRAADALLAHSGAESLVIVGHSMGGLVTRAYLRAHGESKVEHVFTIGTPHHGTRLAGFGLGPNAAQMRHDSAWLRELDAGESAQRRALFTSIYTHHDNIVAPQTASLLAGARNIAFGGIGHVALGRNRRILALLMRELAALPNRSRPAPSSIEV